LFVLNQEIEMPSFEDILSQPVDKIETPKPLPVGTYQWLIAGQPRQDKSQQKQTPFVEWQCKCQGAQDDVDQDALNESLGGKSLSDITRRLTFYITEDSVYRLQEFLFKHLQVAEVGSGVSLREAIAMAAGHSFLGTIRHQPSPDGTRVYDNISTTAAI
jgi:hypothetical protein